MIVFDELNQSYLMKLFRAAARAPVIVVGSGVTGRALIRLFCKAGLKVIVIDEQEIGTAVREQFLDVQWLAKFETRSQGDSAPNNGESILRDLEVAFAVLSPGINPRGSVGSLLEKVGIPCITELDVTLPFLGMPEICITGTNGKTTTVSLISEMLNRSDCEAICVGNVGTPFADLVEAQSLKQVVSGGEFEVLSRPIHIAELSSYQLETLLWIRPLVAGILNVEDDHLERHGSFEGYLAAKARITNWQTSADYLLLPQAEAWSAALANKTAATPIWFGSSRRGVMDNDSLSAFWEMEGDKVKLLLDSTGCEQFGCAHTALLGEHNRLNIAVAAAAARILGATPEGIQVAIDSFKPLQHRIEFVRTVKGIHYINDSKGTNVSAVIIALAQIKDRYPVKSVDSTQPCSRGNVHLLLGGKIKEGDWTPIRSKLPGQVCSVIAFGGDRQLVLERLELVEGESENGFQVSSVPTLENAVLQARQFGMDGDVVLLSPGCASFDAYSDYTARGADFRRIVNNLVE